MERLLETDRALGLRVIESRFAYTSRDFEWDQNDVILTSY